MEMADALAITKADGDNRVPAKRARAEYASALHLFPPHPSGWVPRVLTCSAQEGEGLADLWQLLRQFRESMEAKGWLEQQRAQQQRHWMHDAIREALLEQFYAHPGVQAALPGLESAVLAGQLPATAAAERLLGQWREG
jgi:LAO/AO transport system kinase